MSLFDFAVLTVTVVGNVVLTLLVLRRNPTSATHRLFALLGLVFALWAVATFYAVNASSLREATWWIRVVMMLAVPQSVLFFLLMHTYPRATVSIPKHLLTVITAITLVVMGLALTPYIFPKVLFTPGQVPQPQPGPGIIAFVPLAIGSVLAGLYYLVRKNISATDIEKIQLRYLLLGASIMFALIIGLNFVAVAFLGESQLATFGPLFTLPFVGLTAYTIIRHRLMDIRLALARSLSFSFLLGAFFLIYGVILIFAVPTLARALQIQEGVIAAVGALIAVLLARYVQEVLRKVTDRVLFQNRADYKQVLEDVSQELSGTIRIVEATNIVLDVMKNIVRARKSAILLLRPETKTFEVQAHYGMERFDVTIQPDNVLLEHLMHIKGTLVKDELALAREQERLATHIKEMNVVNDVLEWLDVAAVVPLFVNKKLTGLMLLGDKLSGEPYLQDDAEFFNTFAAQASVVLENARLYQESLQFGEKLQIEIDRATRELAMANQQLKNLDKAKSEFLSIASHQLYTPLTAIRGYLSMLLEGDFGNIADKQTPIMDILEKSAKRLIDLIKNLLDVSRIESGRLELELASVDLVDLAKELVRELKPNADQKKLVLALRERQERVPHVVVDRDRIRQVMLNFIDNAIKYTDTGTVTVSVNRKGDTAEFAVKDTGKGISREDLIRLFNKFTRVGGSSRFHTEGVGLGLYVARQIVKEHRGEVEAASAGVGKGSTFIMSLPVEGTPKSLKVGEKTTVEIKAAEATGIKTKARV